MSMLKEHSFNYQSIKKSYFFASQLRDNFLFMKLLLAGNYGRTSNSFVHFYPYFSLDYLYEFIVDDFINYKNGSRGKPIPARYATNIIDAYLYDEVFSKVSSENDRKILHHPLMRQEINRQNADLVALSRENWTEMNWEDVKLEAEGKGVLKI